MPDPPKVLDALESFFGGDASYRTWELKGGASHRVLSLSDCPGPGLTTHVAFDAVFVDWKGVKPGFRLFPIVPVLTASDPEGDGSFHAAFLLDTALTSQAPPKPTEIIVRRGHCETLPHVRYDYPFPWERQGPASIDVEGEKLMPVLAYSVSDAETRFQMRQGHKALEALFEEKSTQLFDRARPCAVGSQEHAPNR